MNKNARVGTAIAAGYVFGRFKKLRMAILVGTALASEDARKSALNLVQHGAGGLTSGGAGKLAGQAGSKIVDVGRSAAVAAAASRLERISDRLAERTEALQQDGTGRADDEPEDEYDEDSEEYDDAEDAEPEEDEEPEEDADQYEEPDEDADQYEEPDEDEDVDESDADDDSQPGSRNGAPPRARRQRAKAPVRAGSI